MNETMNDFMNADWVDKLDKMAEDMFDCTYNELSFENQKEIDLGLEERLAAEDNGDI